MSVGRCLTDMFCLRRRAAFQPCIGRAMLSLGDKSRRLRNELFSAASYCLGRLKKHFTCLWICTEAVGTTRPFEHHEYEHNNLPNQWHQT